MMYCAFAVLLAVLGCVFFVYKAMDSEDELRKSVKIIAQDGILWIDYQYFCRYGDGYGRTTLSTGRFPIKVEYSSSDESFLPRAGSIGWLGSTCKRGLVLGHVLGPLGVLPCEDTVCKLRRKVIDWTKEGRSIYLEVQDVSIF